MGVRGFDSSLYCGNMQAGIDIYPLSWYQFLSGEKSHTSFVDADGNLVLEGVAVEVAELV